MFWKVFAAHLVKMIAPLLVGDHYETKHLLTRQGSSALRFFWLATTVSVDVLEILAACRQEATTERLVVEGKGDGPPLDLVCHATNSPFASKFRCIQMYLSASICIIDEPQRFVNPDTH